VAQEIPFRLGNFASASGKPYAAIVFGDTAVDLNLALKRTGIEIHADAPVTIRSLLDDWDTNFDKLTRLANRIFADGINSATWRDVAIDATALRVLPPVMPPGTLFQSGANYRTHVVQLMVAHRFSVDKTLSPEAAYAEATRIMDERARNGSPFIFTGVPAAICGARDDVILPRRGTQHDWELELAVIFGQQARNISRAHALDCVAGYTIANDLTTRDLVFRKEMLQLGADWVGSKNAPTFFPTGPYLVPRAFVPDPMNLRITLRLNGQIMQDESTADMIFDVARLIEYTSQATVISPGDMLLTGSPAGNGSHYNRFLRPGDVMEGEITGLGRQVNHCVAESEAMSVGQRRGDSSAEPGRP
jgi:2,4-diketo-3-deoxy-L-fuconate hydrolase